MKKNIITPVVLKRNKFSSGFKFLGILLFMLLLSGKSWGADVIPKLYLSARNTPQGNTGWTITNAPIDNASTDYWKMLSTNASLISAAMNLNSFTGESCVIKLGTFGSVNAAKQTITVYISTDNGGTWSSSIATRTPTSSSSTAMTAIDLSSYSGTQVKLKFANLGGDASTGVRFFEAYIIGTAVSNPTVTTPTSADITSSSATLGGNITSNGGATLTERGIYYSTTNGFADGAGTKVAGTGTSTGAFMVAVTGLNASTTYYYKAYATNSAGTGYSTQGTFATSAGGVTVPTLSSPTSTSVTSTSATLGGTITSDGGNTLTERGIYWSTNNGFADGAGTKIAGTGTSTGVFTVAVNSGLSYSTPYYYKAYATNGVGTGYSAQGTFTTSTPALNSPGAKSFTNVVHGTSSELKFTVNGTNLVANIGLALTGDNADLFSLSSASVAVGTEISLTYSPTAAGSHSATLTLSSTGASSVQIAVTGTAINPTLGTPTATAATSVNALGFTANWNAVANATSYSLEAYTKEGSPLSTKLSENFNGFSAGSIATPTSSDISGSLNTYTQTTGWTGSKVYQAGGATKMGTASLLGYIVTPAINLSAESSSFTVNFKSVAWSGDSPNLKIYLNGSLVHTVTDLNTNGTSFKPYSIVLTGGTASSTIKFEGNAASNSRFFLEDVSITQGGNIVNTPIAGSPFMVATNAKVIAGLSPQSTYYYKVTATEAGYNSSVVSNEITAATSSAYYRTTDNGNWTSTSLWEYSADGVIWHTTTTVPSATAKNVEIAKTITVPDANSVSAEKVTINGDSKLTVAATGTLTISDTITFVSTDAGTAQLLNEGTITNNGVVKMRKTFLRTSGWYFISFPFNVSAANVLKTDGTQATWGDLTDNGKDFYVAEYDAASRAAGNFNATSSPNWISLGTHTLVANKGYIIGVDADNTLDFVSSTGQSGLFATTADVNVAKHTSTVGANQDWNLIGIPLSSSFNLVNATQEHAPFYCFNGTTYATVMAADSYNAYPFSSFFLQAWGAPTAVTFASAGRLVKSVAIPNFDEIGLVVKNAKYRDKTRIRLQDGSIDGYELGKDALKLFSPKAGVPQISTKQNGLDLSVNTLPVTTTKADVNVKISEDGAYTISLEDVEKAAGCNQVVLVDNGTGATTDLLAGESYSFAGTAGATKALTVLLSSNNTGNLSTPDLPGDVGGGDVETSTLNEVLDGASVFGQNGNIVVSATSGLVKAISVYNVQGQQVKTVASPASYQIIPMNNAGSYVVKLQSENAVKVYKVLVK